MSFLSDYFNVLDASSDCAVLCPFEHHTSNGIAYMEEHPSAHVNTIKKVFHCKVCGVGYSEPQLISKLFDCSYVDARKVQNCFNNDEDINTWRTATNLTEQSKEKALSLGISEEVLKELNITTPTGALDTLAFPVFMYNHLVDVRIYNPGHTPKVKSRSNNPTGFIIPFDIWQASPLKRITLICAGEKDMAIARSVGFNAITLTGGEKVLPKHLNSFKGRPVVIAYDNDDAGKAGAKKLALKLINYAESVKILTNFHEVCKENGEDLTDFFMKYKKEKRDLINYIENTPVYVPAEEDIHPRYKTMSLLEASKPENLNKMVQANIQVVAVSDSTFTAPNAIIGEKTENSGQGDTMFSGEIREWELNENNCQDILHLCDNNFKEKTIDENIRNLLKIMQKERCIKIQNISKVTVFKAVVTDLFETTDTSIQAMEYTAYSIQNKLESGKKYLATFKVVPHPYKGQQLIMIITDVVQANDSVSNFIITENVKKHLDVFKNLIGTVPERIDLLTNKVKGILGYNGNNTLIKTLDLSYHTVLEFNFGSFKNIRGYLDTIIIGESRVGKSSTAEALRKTYELGVFTSLAGNSATIPGLIGGSNKTSNGYQTRAGVIPQNHKGLIIFEEFGKSNANVMKELTDIRSSNEVRITRVSGTITLPAIVRMIALTNVKASGSGIKSIASYPNGFSIVTELVDTAEDIARYDLICILSDKGNSQIDPFWEPEEPFAKELYQTRIRWVWSRTPEQIIISRDVGNLIIKYANELNENYPCHIKIFGTECWKKLSRLAIAIAGYLVSTDESYENIVLKEEHVIYAYEFLKNLYDNPTFKLKEYVEHEQRYTKIDDDGVARLQTLYEKFPSLILQLEQSSSATRPMLGAATGLNNDDLNKALNELSKALFIRFINHDIIPTERFRIGLNKINKNTSVRGIGES